MITLFNSSSQMLKTHLVLNFTPSANFNLDLRNTYQNYQRKIGLIYQNLDVQIRTSPIETGRWQNIARNDRICTFCRDNIGDEFHICLFANMN